LFASCIEYKEIKIEQKKKTLNISLRMAPFVTQIIIYANCFLITQMRARQKFEMNLSKKQLFSYSISYESLLPTNVGDTHTHTEKKTHTHNRLIACHQQSNNEMLPRLVKDGFSFSSMICIIYDCDDDEERTCQKLFLFCFFVMANPAATAAAETRVRVFVV
jgi:hypothetical protein